MRGIDPIERLWLNVNRSGPGGCWLWTGPIDRNGYGVFNVGGRSDLRKHRAHRFVYEILVGPIPEGLVLDHVRALGCRHRHCVNPAHLEPVTQGTNVRRGDAPAAEHARKTQCVNGHLFTPGNTYVRNGWRYCRTCRNNTEAARYRRLHAEAKASGAIAPSNSEKTHCPQSHPYDEVNTYVTKAGRRACKECNRTRAREHARRKRAEVKGQRPPSAAATVKVPVIADTLKRK